MRRLCVTLVLLLGILLSSSVQALTLYQTTLNLTTPVPSAYSIDKVVYNWSTNETSGFVINTELIDLSMQLFNGGSQIYQDVIMLGGLPQSFGGGPAVRSLIEVSWSFDLNTFKLNRLRNVLFNGTQTGSTGVQYQVYIDPFVATQPVIIKQIVNGIPDTQQYPYTISSQSTTTVIPEPTTLTLLGFGFIGMFGYLRKRRKFL